MRTPHQQNQQASTNLIGTTPAPAVAAKNLKNVMGNNNRFITFVIVRSDDRILMQKRDDGNGKQIPYPNMWTIPGGDVQDTETHLHAVVREIKEEFKMEIASDQCRFLFSYDHDDVVGEQIFLCHVSDGVQPILHEGAAMQWMVMDEIKKLPLAFEKNKILSQIASNLKMNKF